MKVRKIWLIPLIIFVLSSNSFTASASSNVPYQTYNYDYWGNVFLTPAAYIPNGNISGVKLGIGNFNNPQDIFVADDGKVYIADTGNNRIVILNKDMKYERTIDSFDNAGTKDTFKSPYGLHVTGKNEIYIADSENLRVVALREDGTLLKIISNPVSEVLDPDFVFTPLKVTVDFADRVYIIAKGMFQGILAFDENGDFQCGIILSHDISHILKNNIRLKEEQLLILKAEHEKLEEAEKTIAMKDEFITLISHEFKTPLNVIFSAIQ
jgi:signal transduction histidine kinase